MTPRMSYRPVAKIGQFMLLGVPGCVPVVVGVPVGHRLLLALPPLKFVPPPKKIFFLGVGDS